MCLVMRRRNVSEAGLYKPGSSTDVKYRRTLTEAAMQTTSDPLTYSKKTFARVLGVSVRTLERLRARGYLPTSLPGLKHPRWSGEAVREWLRASGERR